MEDSLDFHRDLGRSTFLPGPNQETHVVYGAGVTTISRVEYSLTRSPGHIGSLVLTKIGDGTVPVESATELDNLASVKEFNKVNHTSLITRSSVLTHVLDIIESA